MKLYFEYTSVCGITFEYADGGTPTGLCKAQKLYYITTSGGFINNYNMGYDYIKGLCNLYGIPKIEFISAEGLDIKELDIELQLANAVRAIESLQI